MADDIRIYNDLDTNDYITITVRTPDCPVGDLNDDCIVDLLDLKLFLAKWSNDPEQSDVDFNGDLRVNLSDFNILAKNWLQTKSRLMINEFLARNNTIEPPDQQDQYDDWIELYNAGNKAIDVGGMYLTDDLDAPLSQWWQFPTDQPEITTIQPHGYLLIWADEDTTDTPGLHANFQLEADNGEEIGLFDTDGSTLLDSITFGKQLADISYGRYPNGSNDWRYLGVPTPRVENAGMGYLGLVVEPEFSVRRGFYEEAFGVILTCPTPGAMIYYTLDSTDPTEASTLYTGTVAVSGTTCLRAAAFRTDYLPSVIVTHTYIFVDDVIDHPDMSTDITQDPVWGPQMHDALLEIPTISLVTPYTIPDYPIQSPPEVPTSIEMIFPDGTKGFQVNAGVERFGGQYTVWPKQALRISFKSIYGPSRLKFDLFDDTPYGGDDATDSFNQIILRNGSHDSLWYGGYTSKGVYTRNRYCFDRQIEMGHLSLRGKFVHMYLNGVYWGLYHLMERPTADFMAAYLGGDEEDYDIMKGRSGIFVAEGDSAAWDYMVANTNNYEIVQEYMDVDNYIDYMLLNFYGGNDHDWYPHHNWIAGRRREAGSKFMFFMWDNDFLMRRLNGNTIDNGGPGNMFNSLVQHEEFKMRLTDRAQKYFFNDGMLTPARVQADFTELTNRIERIIIPECARWSQEGSGGSYTPDTLQQSVDWIKFTHGNVRTDIVVQQMRNKGIFPSIDAPTFSQHGGEIAPTEPISMTAPAGVIYYTIDGADPRLPGGAVNTSHAIEYTVPINLTQSTCLKARARSGGTWSALNEAVFAMGPVVENLRITEIMYHPPDPPVGDPNAEFIEVMNIHPTDTINLALVRFTNGIEFEFPPFPLNAGQRAVVVKNQAAFEARYGTGVNVVPGDYSGSLSNGGEEIDLDDALGAEIHDFDYKDGWYEITDGLGFSLTIRNPYSTDPNDWDRKSGWRAGFVNGGSPGGDDSSFVLDDDAIIINELLAHSDTEPSDWIEFYNTTVGPIDISGWFISDDGTDLMKYEIEENFILPAHGYAVFYADPNFGPGSADPGSHTGFALTENGEKVYLTSGSGGALTGVYSTERRFHASAPDVSFGHYVKSIGTDFVAMSSNTPGWENAYPKVGPVVINEIAYNPNTNGDAEFVELLNISGGPVTLYDAAKSAPWRFVDDWEDDTPGLEYFFPAPPSVITLADGEYFLLIKNEIAFETVFLGGGDISTLGVQWAEWGGGSLNNGGEQPELQKPGDPGYYIRVDRVKYSDGSHPVGNDPWPTEPDDSDDYVLERINTAEYGNDVVNWQADAPTPGKDNDTPP